MSIWALYFGGVSFNVFTCIASLATCIHPAPCPSCFLWHVFSYSWFLHSVVTKRCVINLLLPHASIVYTLGYRTACYRSEWLFSLQDVHLSVHRVNKKSCLIYRINKYICFSVYFSLPSILLFTSFFFSTLPSPSLPLPPPLSPSTLPSLPYLFSSPFLPLFPPLSSLLLFPPLFSLHFSLLFSTLQTHRKWPRWNPAIKLSSIRETATTTWQLHTTGTCWFP